MTDPITFALLVSAAVSGTAEALVSAATPRLLDRAKRAADMVERQPLSDMEKTVLAAVKAATVEMLADYSDAGDLAALLRHPPFAEELTRKLVHRGIPDFERLRTAYLDLKPGQSSERWAALEDPLLDFFDAIEDKLDEAGGEAGDILQEMRKLTRLTRIEETNQIIAHASESLVALNQAHLRTLGEIAAFLRENPTVHTGGGANIQGDVNTGGDFVNRDKIVNQIYHIYQSGPGHPQLSEAEFSAALIRYLDWVQNRYGHLNLRGIATRKQRVLSLTLEDVYVSLMVAVTPQRKQGRVSGRRRETDEAEMTGVEQPEQRIVDMADLLALSERLAIIGGPGSGKTTFLHNIAVSIAHALRTGDTRSVIRHLKLTEDLPLPIFLTLGDYNRYRKACRNAQDPNLGTLTTYISHSLISQEAGLGLPTDFFVRLLRGGKRCIVLLDGLDEVADEDDRAIVRQAVEDLAANPGVYQILVTSRSRAYTDQSVLGQAFQVAEVQTMSLEQAQTLANRWCHAAYDPTRAANESKSLQTAIAKLERLRKERGDRPLIDSPLMVTIVAIVHDEGGKLPDERADLYQRCIKALLAETYKPATEARTERNRRGGSETEKRSLLTYLAFCMMGAGEEQGRRVSETQIKSWLRPQLVKLRGEQEADTALTAFLEAVAARGSLLNERSHMYEFIHLTFQEFLAASYLVDSEREIDKIVAHLFADGHIAQSWWRETVLLTVGYLGLGSIDAPLSLVGKLATHPAPADVVVGAAEVAAAGFLEQNGQDPETLGLLVNRLVGLIQDRTHPGTPEQRLAAGKVLAQLGDPRPGVGLRADGLPDIAWHKVPKANDLGETIFIYRMGEKREEETFWMARYPITHRQFNAFVDDEDGFHNPVWWKGLNRTDNDNPEKPGLPNWNHPRDRVSWYQAVAFCHWLTAQAKTQPTLLPAELRNRTDWRITLPTEWQWEKAARGHDGRAYPWGEKYIPGHANADETKRKDGYISRGVTSAVGLYPQGVSPYGLLDLIGNVWEWCLNEYHDPENTQEDGDEWRVLRGGSSTSSVPSISASTRNNMRPRVRGDSNGFRVVVVVPSSHR